VLGILSDAHHIHGAHKGQVVSHNLSQLGEMPPVPATFAHIRFTILNKIIDEKNIFKNWVYLPFSTAHNVIVQLFVQVV
jgi:hypothetical protein